MFLEGGQWPVSIGSHPDKGQDYKDVLPILDAAKVSLPKHTLSPLRYPGSKRKIIPSIKSLVDDYSISQNSIIEPFAGGASVSLGLLELKSADCVYINDANRMIWAFWKTATENSEWLIARMKKEPVTLDRWDYWKKKNTKSVKELAMKCLFLNRTSFSGIIAENAGPIGGRSQEKNKIECRFNKDALEKKISYLHDLYVEDKIIVSSENFGWQGALLEGRQKLGVKNSILYLDPPYVEKASRIYRKSFTDNDHKELASYLKESNDKWILSYDDEPLIRHLYLGASGIKGYNVPHKYSMKGNRKSDTPGREIIFTNKEK